MNKLKNNAWFRKVGMALLDIVLILLSVYLSMELRFEMYIPTRHAQTMFSAMPLVVAVYMACYVFGGIYQIMWRYAGVRDVARLCLLSAIACGVTLALNQFLALGLFRGVLILIALMATIAVGGSRMIWRVCSKDRISGSLDDAMPVMIVGAGEAGSGDAVKQANTPNLDKLMASCPMTGLKAHGTAVGLPTDDDMGNSEVGHNALGCGQIYSQGAKLVGESIETGALYESKTWKALIANCKDNGKALHFLGLLSDGNVHSNISHLIAMLKKAREEDVKRVYCHILLDGRDVPATSALDYVDQLETVLAGLSDAEHEYKIASGGGRMVITMDRYEANWPMVEKGWRTHVQGEGRQFDSAKEAIETYRSENPAKTEE